MSIISALIGSVQSGSGGGGPPPAMSAYATYGASPTEGYGTDITVYVENWTGARIHWSVVGKGSPAANPSTDMTGQLSGFWDPGATTASSNVVTTVNFVADTTTEGTEYWGVNLGSSENGYDFFNGSAWGITDASTTPTPSITDVTTSIGAEPATEGVAINVTVTTANYTNGTTLAWWKASGSANISDFSHQTGDNIESGELSGTFTISNNSCIFSILPRADQFTEGTESLTINIGPTDRSSVLWNISMNIGDNSTMPALMVPVNTTGVPTVAIDGAVWPAYDGSGGSPSGVIHGTWTRDTALTTYGGVTSGGNSYIEFPTRVTRNTFSIEMVANFTNVGGWQSIWDTGNMNDGGVGYTCVYLGTQMFISTNYDTGSAGQASFNCSAEEYEGLTHWVFVVDLTSGDNCKVYRNGTELSKISGTAVAPLDYGTKPLMISARRGPSDAVTNFARGTIYSVNASPSAYDASTVAYILNTSRTTYGMTLSGPPTWGYGGNLAVFGTDQYSKTGGNNIVQVGWQVIAVGGTQDGWIATISETNATAAGGLRVGSDTWPTDAASYVLRPF